MKAPRACLYCDGEGNSTAGGSCGFCENGRPLDTQDDWDRSWGDDSLQVRVTILEQCVDTLQNAVDILLQRAYKEER